MVALAATVALTGCGDGADPTAPSSGTTTTAAGASGTPGTADGPVVDEDPLPHGSVQVTQVSGVRDDGSGQVTLNPAKVLPAAQRPPVVPGSVTARLVDDEGAVLAEATGELSAFSDGDMSNFTIFLDTPAVPAATLEVDVDGALAAVAEAPGGIPTVTITEPDTGGATAGGPVVLRWEAAADEEAEFVYAVYATADGRTWRSVVGETTDTTATVAADLVAEEDLGAARVLVTVSDGVNGSVTALRPFG